MAIHTLYYLIILSLKKKFCFPGAEMPLFCRLKQTVSQIILGKISEVTVEASWVIQDISLCGAEQALAHGDGWCGDLLCLPPPIPRENRSNPRFHLSWARVTTSECGRSLSPQTRTQTVMLISVTPRTVIFLIRQGMEGYVGSFLYAWGCLVHRGLPADVLWRL